LSLRLVRIDTSLRRAYPALTESPDRPNAPLKLEVDYSRV
jgi:hypothetical protein